MKRCTKCLIPDTRPDTEFIDDVCMACIAHDRRKMIDWKSAKDDLIDLLDRHNGRCIVPSSGGKDSTYQVMTLLELGADVTVVTATTCHLTRMGRSNIDNLAQYAKTIEVTPNMTVRRKLNRLGLHMVGDISWPEHVAIFTVPFRMACHLGIPLIFYGENPQNQYGGPQGSEQAREMTRRWVSEYGGFLGLRPDDMIGQDGITQQDMDYYQPPSAAMIKSMGVEAHFLGQYIPWDSHRNLTIAQRYGFKYEMPCLANFWAFENQDNAQTGIHDHMMFRKYGYGRGCAQISVDIRDGLIDRESAARWVRLYDGNFPDTYMDIKVEDILDRIGVDTTELKITMNKFTNWSLFPSQTLLADVS